MFDAARDEAFSTVVGRIGYDVVDRPIGMKKVDADFPGGRRPRDWTKAWG
jgi:hypothetical protein